MDVGRIVVMAAWLSSGGGESKDGIGNEEEEEAVVVSVATPVVDVSGDSKVA